MKKAYVPGAAPAGKAKRTWYIDEDLARHLKVFAGNSGLKDSSVIEMAIDHLLRDMKKWAAKTSEQFCHTVINRSHLGCVAKEKENAPGRLSFFVNTKYGKKLSRIYTLVPDPNKRNCWIASFEIDRSEGVAAGYIKEGVPSADVQEALIDCIYETYDSIPPGQK